MKPLHRMILLTSAYRQSSISPIEKRRRRRRIRERAAVEVQPPPPGGRGDPRRHAGRLRAAEPEGRRSELHGPIDPDLVLMLKRPQYWVADARQDREYDRRTLYLIYKRNLRLPFVEVFDAPDTLLTCARREQSTHAPQALELLNGKTSNELAAAFAERLLKERTTPAERIDYAWRLAAGRSPTAAEKALAVEVPGRRSRTIRPR